MFALREFRTNVTQEDFEMAVGKVINRDTSTSIKRLYN
jgi:ATP-dependent 26S proteasome regulatory subunit